MLDINLDATDIRILNELQRDALLTSICPTTGILSTNQSTIPFS